jgi:membrane fusion protein (multidrug efflux system)
MQTLIKKLKLLITITGLIPLFFTACQSADKDDKKPAAKPAQPPSKVDGYIVSPKLLSQDIEVPGSLMPYEETEVHPEVAGRVISMNFKEGSTIAQGSQLVKLYDGDLQAQLQKLQVQLKVAEQTQERYAELLKINGVSQQEYDLNVLAANNIRADINIIRTSISKTSVRAPFSGKTGLRNISIGAYITPQTVITTVRKLSQLKLEFTVPETYGSKMKPGVPVDFTIENNKNVFSAKIIATENNINEATRSLMVRAVVDKPAPELIAGSFAKVKIPLGENDAALMIPSQAIIPQARNKKVIAIRNGMASMETVTTGARDSAMVEITSGLKVGDTVIITGLLTTKPGSKVLLNNLNATKN